jgi:hypothetical protein
MKSKINDYKNDPKKSYLSIFRTEVVKCTKRLDLYPIKINYQHQQQKRCHVSQPALVALPRRLPNHSEEQAEEGARQNFAHRLGGQ